jgi:hypothetical protein
MLSKNINKRILPTNEAFLVLSPATVKIVGRSAAIVLQQLHYWISSSAQYGHEKDGKRWIYNTYEEWQKQIKVFSTKTIQRAFKTLLDFEIVLSERLNKKASDQTRSYTIVYEKLSELLNVEVAEFFPTKDKMTKSSGQNVQIFIKNTEKTAEKTSLSERAEKSEKIEIFDLNQNNQDSESTNVAEQMLALWNDIIENNQPISLNIRRTRFLTKAHGDSFNSDMNQWTDYCYKIASSKFLMGEVNDFKASLDWCLKFDVIQKINEGQYSQGTRDVKRENKDSKKIMNEFNINHETFESIEAIALRNKIKSDVTAELYISWFEDTRILIEQGRGTLFVGNAFKKDRIKNQFRDLLESLDIEVECCKEYMLLTENDNADVRENDNANKSENREEEFCENKSQQCFSENKDVSTHLIDQKNRAVLESTHSFVTDIELTGEDCVSPLDENKTNDVYSNPLCLDH